MKNIELKGTKPLINPIQVSPNFVNEQLTLGAATSLDVSDCIVVDVHETLSFSDSATGVFIEVTGYTIHCADMEEIFVSGSGTCYITKHKGM